MLKKHFAIFVIAIVACLCLSCEKEESFGFPSKIDIPVNGGTVDIIGSNDLKTPVIQFELLDYDGDGNSSSQSEANDYMEVTTDWLTVKYFASEYKLSLTASPNTTGKKRKLYLYLYSGYSRQEITIAQAK